MSSQITTPKCDKDLIAEIREDSKSAFQLLFHKYYKRLVEFCFYRLRNLDSSKDLVQEIFTNLWISRKKLDPKKSIKSYLYKSATNRLINLSKHSSSKSLTLDDSILVNQKRVNEEIEDKIDIYTSIEKLPQKMKTVFMLSRNEGFKYSEIADICNISIKAVEKRMTKALRLLRKSILK